MFLVFFFFLSLCWLFFLEKTNINNLKLIGIHQFLTLAPNASPSLPATKRITKLTEETQQHADKHSTAVQSERQHNKVSKEGKIWLHLLGAPGSSGPWRKVSFVDRLSDCQRGGVKGPNAKICPRVPNCSATPLPKLSEIGRGRKRCSSRVDKFPPIT